MGRTAPVLPRRGRPAPSVPGHGRLPPRRCRAAQRPGVQPGCGRRGDRMGIARAWPAPAAHTQQATAGPFAVSHRPGRAGGGAVPGSHGECTRGSDEREPVAGHRHRKSGYRGVQRRQHAPPPGEYVPRQRRAATASRPRLCAKHAAGRQRHAQ